jgi:hypothetical protein
MLALGVNLIDLVVATSTLSVIDWRRVYKESDIRVGSNEIDRGRKHTCCLALPT